MMSADEPNREMSTGNGGCPDDTTKPTDYTQFNEFTSEVFKIEIKNIRQFLAVSNVKKRLQSLGLDPHKVKVLQGVTFVTFKSEEDRTNALKVLNGHRWKGQVLTAKPAMPKADPLISAAASLKRNKTLGMTDVEAPHKKKAKILSPEEECKLVIETVTPLRDVSYERQLDMKQKKSEKILADVSKRLSHANLSYSPMASGLPCDLKTVLPSPVTEKYRNKCQFTISQVEVEAEESTRRKLVVGFRVGKFKDGFTNVLSAHNIDIMPDSMAQLLRRFEDFLNTSPVSVKYDAFDPHVHTGHWRELTLRSMTNNQNLAIVDFHPQNLSDDELVELEGSLISSFSQDPAVTSLYISYKTRGADCTHKHLFGAKCIQEKLCNLHFNISALSFFQVNTFGAEVLYKSIADIVKSISPSGGLNDIVLDACCGTGTIGLCLASSVKKVVGIELIPEAVEDAKANAELNKISNCEFFAGKAEDLFPKHVALLAEEIPSTGELIVIVDPPRSGLHSSVISVLRRCEKIKSIVYVSCNPEAASSNFIDLGRTPSNKWRGSPFLPVIAQPVDLFPHTDHFELILVFRR